MRCTATSRSADILSYKLCFDSSHIGDVINPILTWILCVQIWLGPQFRIQVSFMWNPRISCAAIAWQCVLVSDQQGRLEWQWGMFRSQQWEPLTGVDGFAKCLLLKIKALESPCINTSVSIHKLANTYLVHTNLSFSAYCCNAWFFFWYLVLE
jgi:hypothetical protein